MKKLAFLAMGMVFSFLFSCRTEIFQNDGLEFIQVSEYDEVNNAENLTFQFNKSIAHLFTTEDWQENTLLKFEPELDGKIRLLSEDEIEFSPASLLPSSQEYKVSIREAMLKAANGGKNEKMGIRKSIRIHTPFLELNGSQLIWKKSEPNPGQSALLLALDFNQPINPQSINEGIEIRLVDKIKEFSLLSSSTGTKVGIEIPYTDNQVLDTQMSITLKKSLKMAGKDGVAKDQITLTLPVPDKDVFEIISLSTDHNAMEGKIFVCSTMQPDEASLNAKIKIDPPVNFSTALSYNGFTISSTAFNM